MHQAKEESLSIYEMGAQLWEILMPTDRRRVRGVLLLVLIGTLLEVVGVGMVIPVVSVLIQPTAVTESPWLMAINEIIGSPSHRGFMLWALGGLFGIFALKNAFIFFSLWRHTRFLFGLQARLASELVAGYLNRPYSYHLEHATPELLQKVSGEALTLTHGVLSPILWLISEGLVVVGLFGLALWVNPIGALVIAGGLGVSVWAYYYLFKSRVDSWGKKTQEHAKGMFRELEHSLGGVKEVKVFGRETFFATAFGVHVERYTKYTAHYHFLSQSVRNVIELLVIGVLLSAIMLLIGTGSPMHTIIPTLAFFAVAAFRLIPSSQRLLANAHAIKFGARSLRLLYPDLIVSRDQSTPSSPTVEHFSLQNSLELREVTFVYPSSAQEVLSNATLSVPRGAMVGFQGKSGEGKSTLVDLILGLLKPTTGKVMVDGNSIHDNLPGWLGNIGYVPQSIFLMDDTLRRNVAFGVPDSEINDARVREVLSLAQLDPFLDSKRDGLNIQIGERGVRLSGGQRQRIGIARALYHDPEVLILDEATASLDLETEKDFIKTLKLIKNIKTLILISHRKSTIAECDSTYQLTQGKINRVNT